MYDIVANGLEIVVEMYVLG